VTYIRPECESDWDGVRDVNDAAFGGSAESTLVERLRADGDLTLSLVAVEDGEIVGHIAFSRLEIPHIDGEHKLHGAALAPMAVAPTHQRLGIGSELVRQGIENCKELDIDVIVVLGHADYYPRFGFSAYMAECLKSPFSGPNLMFLPLIQGVLSDFEGFVIYADAFGVDPQK